MSFQLPELPYDRKALEPHISAKTLEFHHGKHHKSYVDSLNQIVDGTPYAAHPLDDVIREATASGDRDLFNNAAQSWNHEFLWQSMSPDGGGDPDGKLAELIEKQFGGADGFREAFRDAATGEFGSGWAWLILENGSLSVESTTDAETPVTRGVQPILTLDVWEHAYYLDYQNERDRYVDAFLEHLVNWEFAAANLDAAPRHALEQDEREPGKRAAGAA